VAISIGMQQVERPVAYWDVTVVLRVKTIRVPRAEVIGNESVPKIIINDTIKLFLNCNQHFGNST